MAGFAETVRSIMSVEDEEDCPSPPRRGSAIVDVETPIHVDSERVADILRRRQRSTKSMLSRLWNPDEVPMYSEDDGLEDTMTTSPDQIKRFPPTYSNNSRHGDDSGDSMWESEDDEGPSNCKQIWDNIAKRLSILSWTRMMTCSTVQADFLAGLTVCVMVIPQSMSYANIAGLPYVYGMYSACVPTLVYAFFGQSRQLAVGPVAMVSLILRAGLQGKLDSEQCPEWYNDDAPRVDGVYQNQVCTDAYIVLSCSVAVMIGIINIAAWLFKISFLVSFLGHPVISGFSTGSAVIIGCSQLKYFLGVKLPSTDHVYELVLAIIEKAPEAKPAPLILGCLWLGFLVLTKRLSRKHKSLKMLGPLGPLLGCISGTLLVWAWPTLRDEYHVTHVGAVPGGMIPWSGNKLTVTWDQFQSIQVTAMSAALIGFMESIAIAKNLADQHGYNVDGGQELLALGVANVIGGIFSCYPVTGSFSRSAVANTTGAQTQLAGVVTAFGMLMVLFFLTPLCYFLPMYALAAVVLNSVLSLIAYDVAIELFKVKKWDFLLWFVAFLGTLFIGPLEGIGIAVLLSLGVIIYESVRPQMTILWRVPGTAIYRSINQETTGQFVPGIFIVRIGASMYFANATYVKDILVKFLEDLQVVNKTEYMILEMTGVVTIDSTAAHVLRNIVHDFRTRGIQTAFAMVDKRAMRTMERCKLVDDVGVNWFFPTVDQAVRGCQKNRHAEEGDTFNFTNQEPEIGVSNDLHHQYTTVSVTLPVALPDLLCVFCDQMSRIGFRVISAEVENTQHLYHILKGDAKLKSKDRDIIRAKAVETLADIFRGTRRVPRTRTSGSLISGDLHETWDAVAEMLVVERTHLMEATARVQAIESKLASMKAEEVARVPSLSPKVGQQAEPDRNLQTSCSYNLVNGSRGKFVAQETGGKYHPPDTANVS